MAGLPPAVMLTDVDIMNNVRKQILGLSLQSERMMLSILCLLLCLPFSQFDWSANHEVAFCVTRDHVMCHSTRLASLT